MNLLASSLWSALLTAWQKGTGKNWRRIVCVWRGGRIKQKKGQEGGKWEERGRAERTESFACGSHAPAYEGKRTGQVRARWGC